MKRVLVFAVASLLGMSAYSAIHDEYVEGYEFVTSKNASSKFQERPISFYKEGKVVFFRGDTAYSATIGNTYDLVNVEVCKELTGLGIVGTFAYDPKRRTIYFAKVDELGNSDLYEAQWTSGSYSMPKLMNIEGLDKLRKKIRGSSSVVAGWTYRYNRISGFFNPSIAKGGNRIYFSANFPKQSYGGRDIWYIDRAKGSNVTADWEMPKNASDSVIRLNSQSREDYPFVVGDSVMYLASDRPGGKGGLDIYVSRWESKSFEVLDTATNEMKTVERHVWTTPVNLDSTFNTPANDYNFVGNNKLVMFLSNRAGGKGSDDIYVPAPFEAERDIALTPEIALTEPQSFNWVLFFFNFGKSDMLPEYYVQLDELISAMREFPGVKFEISGHTDSRGSDKFNTKLSQDRANYVKSLIIQRGGFSSSDIVAVGKSFHDPVIPNAQTEPEHEQNRRVEVRILNDNE